MNYAKTPDARPWARDLSEGDILSATQERMVCAARLSDFDLHCKPYRDGNFIVRVMTEYDHRERRRNSVGNVGVW